MISLLITFLRVIVHATSINYVVIILLFYNHPLFFIIPLICNHSFDLTSGMWFISENVINQEFHDCLWDLRYITLDIFINFEITLADPRGGFKIDKKLFEWYIPNHPHIYVIVLLMPLAETIKNWLATIQVYSFYASITA